MNPRFIYLLDSYRQHDQITLILAGIALAAVLGQLAMGRGAGRSRLLEGVYSAFLIAAWILILAGSAYILFTGGYL